MLFFIMVYLKQKNKTLKIEVILMKKLILFIIFFCFSMTFFYNEAIAITDYEKAQLKSIWSNLFNNTDLGEISENYYTYNIWKNQDSTFYDKFGHMGIDFQTSNIAGGNHKEYEQKFYAISEGIVILPLKSNLNPIIIYDEKQNITTIYLHCNVIYVKLDKKVKVGELLGIVGAKGSNNAWHIHFEARPGKQTAAALTQTDTIDPLATAMKYLLENKK